MTSHLPDDAYLLAGLRLGDPQVVKDWFEAYHSRLLAFVVTKISTPHDAEEITQETFINCLKHLPLFRGSSSIWTWMVHIASHEIADYYRKKYAKKAIKTLPLASVLLTTTIRDAHGTAEKVKRVLSQMSAESVELLMAKYVDNQKVQDIADQQARTLKAIESDLFRARREFRMLWLALE